MKIYHYVTGILNPTKEEVLNGVLDELTDQYESEDEEKDEEKDEEELNNTRREVTFVFEINAEDFLGNVKVSDWEKMKSRNDIMKSMNVTIYNFITQTDYTTENVPYVDPEEYEDIDPFHVLFMTTDQGIKIDCDIEEELPNSLIEKHIGHMCADEYDAFIFIEKEFEYGFTTPNCEAGNYECSYNGGIYNKKTACNKCLDLW
jgi:hypothetical protein